jgi:hypothetical protein
MLEEFDYEIEGPGKFDKLSCELTVLGGSIARFDLDLVKVAPEEEQFELLHHFVSPISLKLQAKNDSVSLDSAEVVQLVVETFEVIRPHSSHGSSDALLLFFTADNSENYELPTWWARIALSAKVNCPGLEKWLDWVKPKFNV